MTCSSIKVVEIEGRVFTPSSLPEVPTRWTAIRKAEIAVCVIGKVLTYDEAQVRYGVSREELVGWMKKYRVGDVGALRIRSIQRLPSDAREPIVRH